MILRKLNIRIAMAVVYTMGSSALAVPMPACPAIETLTVDSHSADGALSSTVLAEGVPYWLVGEGTWRYQIGDPRTVADPEWARDYHDELCKEYFPNPNYTPDNLDLMVDGDYDNPDPSDWFGSPLADPNPCDPADFETFWPHVQSPSHRYMLPILGHGEPIRVWIYDSKYTDNAGSLTVGIHEVVPEPATLAFLTLGALGLMRRRRGLA